MDNWTSKWLQLLMGHYEEKNYHYTLEVADDVTTIQRELNLIHDVLLFQLNEVPVALKAIFKEKEELIDLVIFADGRKVRVHPIDYEFMELMYGSEVVRSDGNEGWDIVLTRELIEKNGISYLTEILHYVECMAKDYFSELDRKRRIAAYREEQGSKRIEPLNDTAEALVEELKAIVIDDTEKRLKTLHEKLGCEEYAVKDPIELYESSELPTSIEKDNEVFSLRSKWIIENPSACGADHLQSSVGKFSRERTAGTLLAMCFFVKSGIHLYDYEKYCHPLDVWEDKLLEETLEKFPMSMIGHDPKRALEIFEDDMNCIRKILVYHPEVLKYAPEKVRNDRGFVIGLIAADTCISIEDAGEDIRNDKMIAKMAISLTGLYLGEFSLDVRSDREVIERGIEQGDLSSLAYIYACEEIRDDKEITIKAVREIGTLLENASETLRADKDVVTEAVCNDSRALAFADTTLRADRAFILELVQEKGLRLEFVPEELQEDREVVFAAALNNVYMLKSVCEKIKADKDFFSSLIPQQPSAYQFANEEIRGDLSLALQAIKKDGYQYCYAPDSIKENRDIALAALKAERSVFKEMPDCFKDDEELIFAALESSNGKGFDLQYASDRIKDNRKIALMAVLNGYGLESISERLRDDKELVSLAVCARGNALKYASERLRNDREVVMLAFESAKKERPWDNLFRYVGTSLHNDKEIVRMAISLGWYVFFDDNRPISSDREIVLEALKGHGAVLEYVSDALKADKEVVMVAVSQDGNALEFASENLRMDQEVVSSAVGQNGEAIRFAMGDAATNEELILKAGQFRHINKIYSIDKERAKEIAINDFYRFLYLPEELRSDRAVQDAFLERWW